MKKNPNDYLIVLRYSFNLVINTDGIVQKTPDELHKTFWLKAKDGSSEQRYSVASSPAWVKRIYKFITSKKT